MRAPEIKFRRHYIRIESSISREACLYSPSVVGIALIYSFNRAEADHQAFSQWLKGLIMRAVPSSMGFWRSSCENLYQPR